MPPGSWAVDPAAASAREIDPGLWRLRLPVAWPHMDHVNAYAMPGAAGGLVLIDCGMGGHPSTLQALERAIANTGHTIADVRELVITHYHTDHMGNAAAIQAASGCTTWGHHRFDEFLAVVSDPQTAEYHRRAHGQAHGARGALLEATATVGEEVEAADSRTSPDRLLSPGQTIASGLGEWQIVELPGHSPSQIGLLNLQHGSLIGADAILPVFASFCEPTSASDPLADSRATVERVATLTPTVLLPGHGRPITDVRAIIDLYRTGFLDRLTKVEAALQSDSSSTATVSARVFALEDPDAAAGVWAFHETHAYLTHLAAHGRVTPKHDDAGRVLWRATPNESRSASTPSGKNRISPRTPGQACPLARSSDA
jgi:glyoxylase-like metal-dependent hydrolase (beta-lactamase superfamily II)